MESLEIAFDNIKNKFTIINTSNILPFLQFNKQDIINIYHEIEKYGKNTGIMIRYFYITQRESIYLFIFDYHIVIIDENNLKFFYAQINDKTEHFYFNSETEEKIKEKLNDKLYKKTEKDQNMNNEPQINQNISLENIKKMIVNSIIKKSQIRSYNRRFETYRNKINVNIKYKYNDFIKIRSMSETVDLHFNIHDQFLYVLKKFDKNNQQSIKQYKHEITFYENIGNQSSFICKYYGQIETEFSKFIIIEYIGGDTLLKFIKNKRNHILKISKLQIIFDLLVAIELIHSKNFIIRDLKIDNIIIDSNGDAVLIDFNQTKEINEIKKENDNDNKEITACIGSDYFTSPEQFLSSKYSQQADMYSFGMCIHFIITEIEYDFNIYDIFQNIDTNEVENNILNYKEIAKCPPDYENIKHIYEHCLNFSPKLRPNASQILINLFNYICKHSAEILIKNNAYPFLANQNDEKFQCHILSFTYNNRVKIETYISYLILAANRNDLLAQNMLGECFCDGKIIGKNIEQSIYFYRLSANQNNIFAQLKLGFMYYEGKDISRDIKKSIYYFTLSANQNNSVAQYILGKIYYDGKYIERDINKSIYYFMLSANQNNSDAQLLLGIIYYECEYIERDINKSIYYLTLSANQNNSVAQYYLGIIYDDREYIGRDINKSIYFLTLSANQNNSDAQYYLGLIYYGREYIGRDINKSIYYFTLSANQNNSDAQYYLGYFYYTGEYIERNINKSIYYLTLSANQNNSNAQCYLGKLYYESEYITRNINKSIYYLTLSANQNNSNAQYYLGEIYYEGKYIVKDVSRSIYYLTLSANQNNCNAQYYLGVIYYEGKYIERDVKKSIYYLTLSANQNISDAQFYLGYVYYEGKYIAEDMKKSNYYIKLAAKNYNSDALFLLGLYYYEKSINKTIYYWKLASDLNNYIAQYFLGILYFNGDKIPRDVNKAIHYFTISANQNYWKSQQTLGIFYYSGQYIQKDIKKSIHYFKEASCFYDNKSKNNLGVIYKNGYPYEVKKNIYNAIEYFEESIRQKNDLYSTYNLLRIYYFGIDLEQNFEKMNQLIEKITDKKFTPINLFLFYIYKYGDETIKNAKKSQYYEKLINDILKFDKIKRNISNEFDNITSQLIFYQRLQQFLKLYDLEYVSNKSFENDFIFYMDKGIFKEPIYYRETNINSLQKDINEEFYKGFYDK